MSYIRRIREKHIKEALMNQLEKSGIPLNEAVEWLWEDFGKKVRRDWRSVRKAVVGDPQVTPQDIAVFMIENGVQPEEGAWDVLPRTSLRGSKTNLRGDKA